MVEAASSNLARPTQLSKVSIVDLTSLVRFANCKMARPTTVFGLESSVLAGLRQDKTLDPELKTEMPIIRVSLWDGRTREQKEKLAEALTKDVMDIAKCPKEHVWIIFEDVKKSDWAIGGKLCDQP